MTKQEAVIALMQGKRVIHKEGDQRLTAGMHDGAFKILGEGWDNACEYNLSDMFEDGYEIVEPEKTREEKVRESLEKRTDIAHWGWDDQALCVVFRHQGWENLFRARDVLRMRQEFESYGYEPQNIIFIGG